MEFKELYLDVSQLHYDELNKYYLHKAKKIKESSFEDSYFDSSTLNLKKIGVELFERNTNKERITFINQKGCVYHENLKSNKQIYLKFIGKNHDIINTLNFKGRSIVYDVNGLTIIFDKFNELNILTLRGNSKSINNEVEEINTQFNVILNQSNSKLKFLLNKHNYKSNEESNEESNDKVYNINDFIVVVEGINDKKALENVYPNINVFITNGLGFTNTDLDELDNIRKKNNLKVLILTDPDVPGEIIRKRISKRIENVYHKYIYNNDFDKKKKKQIGVEALSEKEIKKIFTNLKKNEYNNIEYKIRDIINAGIYFDKQKRRLFCKENGIAFGNNKKVLKQINSYNIKL